MSREKQVNESKELIENALLKKLHNKKLSDIKMSEIAEEACIARMTLYRHFENKEDIIIYIIEKKIKKEFKKSKEDKEISIYDILLFRFRILKNSPFTKMLFENNYLDKLFELMREKSLHKLILSLDSELDPLIITFLSGGIDSITKKWISDGMIISPEEIAKKSSELILELKQYLIK